MKSFLEGHRDQMLAEAKSEIMKQECKVDSLDTCIPLTSTTCSFTAVKN